MKGSILILQIFADSFFKSNFQRRNEEGTFDEINEMDGIFDRKTGTKEIPEGEISRGGLQRAEEVNAEEAAKLCRLTFTFMKSPSSSAFPSSALRAKPFPFPKN